MTSTRATTNLVLLRFTDEVEHYLRSLPGVEDVRRTADAFAIDFVVASGPRRCFLDNVFADSRELSPEQRHAKIASFFAWVVAEDDDGDDSWDAARETFVPVLRGTTYGIETWGADAEAQFARRTFVPFLDELVVMDRSTTMEFVTRSAVKRWNVDESDVFEAAAARTDLLADATVELYDDTHGPLWVVTSNDSYESSRLLVPGWLASFRGRVDGEPVAIIPDRTTLMVGGDGRAEMVERLLVTAEREFAASTRRLSPALYTVNRRQDIVPYERHGTDALAKKVRINHQRLAIYEHGEQKEALDKLFAQNGTDVLVTSYEVFSSPDGLAASYTIWTKGTRSYLPRSEKVVLVVPGGGGEGEGANASVSVEVRFEQIADRLTPVAGLSPARFETSGPFPDGGDLRMLGYA